MAQQAGIRVLSAQPRPAVPRWQTARICRHAAGASSTARTAPLSRLAHRWQIEQADRLDASQLSPFRAGHLPEQERAARNLRDPR
jgi:hypothetical protein